MSRRANRPMTFLADYWAGRATAADIDDHIDWWHDGPALDGFSLHQFLGLTWEQYAAWAERGVLPVAPSGLRHWWGGLVARARRVFTAAAQSANRSPRTSRKR